MSSRKLKAATEATPLVLSVQQGKDEPKEGDEACDCCGRRCRFPNEAVIAALIAGVLATGGLNRVAGKIMSVPMGDFSFFLGTFNGVFYCVFYMAILLIRYGLGYTSKKHALYAWSLTPADEETLLDPDSSLPRRFCARFAPWKWFLLMGLNDGLANVLGLLAQPHVSGTMSALVSQLIVLFSMGAALALLGTRYTFWQQASVALVIGGVGITLIPTFMGGDKGGSDPLFTAVMALSTLPNAISFTLKEKIFQEVPGLDVFVVNSHSSLFQLLLQPVFLPLTLLFNQTMGLPFLEYIGDGFTCFGGVTPENVTDSDCSPNPWPYLAYIFVNISFNLLLLFITKRASALLSFMAIKAVLPISILLFYINWPLIGSAPLSYYTLGGLAVVLAALVGFRFFTLHQKRHRLRCCSIWLPGCRLSGEGEDPAPA